MKRAPSPCFAEVIDPLIRERCTAINVVGMDLLVDGGFSLDDRSKKGSERSYTGGTI